MPIFPNPEFQHCPHLGRSVCTNCTEGRCRERNDCDAQACALESEFGPPMLARTVSGYAAAFGLGWLTAR